MQLMTLHLVTVIYDFVFAKCYVIHILLDRKKSNQIKSNQIIQERVFLKYPVMSESLFSSSVKKLELLHTYVFTLQEVLNINASV